MPNIFDKQSDILKKKKTSGIRPYNFHQKIDEHLQQSSDRSGIKDLDEVKKAGISKSEVLNNLDQDNGPSNDEKITPSSDCVYDPPIGSGILSKELGSLLVPYPLPITEFAPNGQTSDIKQADIRQILARSQTANKQIIGRYQTHNR